MKIKLLLVAVLIAVLAGTAFAQGNVGDEFVLVEGGTFLMGIDKGEKYERPAHKVTVDSFYMCKHEVTQAEYKSVMGEHRDLYEGDNRPVASVTWNEAVEYCNALSIKAGLVPCYKNGGRGGYTCDFSSDGYRLPTEAEWEYAARGGNKGRGTFYSGSNNADKVAWHSIDGFKIYKEPSVKIEGTHNVMTKSPNELGLYDMSGNVWEWCWDWCKDYSVWLSRNPTGPTGNTWDDGKALRGGGYYGDAESCRVTNRERCNPLFGREWLGFRVVRSSPEMRMFFSDRKEKIESAANKNAESLSGDESEDIGLFEAAKKNNAKRVLKLLRLWADVNSRDDEGATVLMVAVDNNSIDVVKLLIDAGADVNAKSDIEDEGSGFTALMKASSKDVLKILIDAGADVNAKDDIDEIKDATFLMFAVEDGAVDIVKILLDSGADVNAKFSNDDAEISEITPLMSAAVGDSVEAVKMLIDAGADVTAKSSEGKTALMYAEDSENVDIAKVIKEAEEKAAAKAKAEEEARGRERAERQAKAEAEAKAKAEARAKAVAEVMAKSQYVTVRGGKLSGEDESYPVGSFIIGATEVTQELYEVVMGANPSANIGSRLPVENITWYDAVQFCNALSRIEGLTPCYSMDDDVICDFSANGWRLPTPEEWIFAAQGGKRDKTFEYSGSNKLDDVAWYLHTSDRHTHEVATKKPNSLGLYDMNGNVSEWGWYKEFGDDNVIGKHNTEKGRYKGYAIGFGGCYRDADIGCTGGREFSLHSHGVGRWKFDMEISKKDDRHGFRIVRNADEKALSNPESQSAPDEETGKKKKPGIMDKAKETKDKAKEKVDDFTKKLPKLW